MTSGLSGLTYEDKLAEVGMMSLEQRRERGDAIQVWKILTKYDDVDESIWFQRCSDMANRDTRQSTNNLNLQHKAFNLDIRKHSFSVRTTRSWNDLPTEVRSTNSLRLFKSAFDDFFWNRERQEIAPAHRLQ